MVTSSPIFHLFFVGIFLCKGNAAQGTTLIVTAVLNEPYVMLKESVDLLAGNDRFEGFSIDLVREMSEMLAFNYTIHLAPDNNKQTSGWDRIVAELLEHRADIAIGDLTITSEREEAVDFSTPFMNTGISLLYTKPIKQPPSLFAFMEPFSLAVWICIAVAYVGVSVLLCILGRFTPSLKEHQDKDDSQFSLINCMFLPRSLSTRIVAGIWWFFILIMVSMYSANCAAFATMERASATIESVDDLAKQMNIKYGVVNGGSTASFFRNSNNRIYEAMWSVMESWKSTSFVSNNAEGADRVIYGHGDYAFLMESAAIEYVTERRCDLTQVGGLLDSKGYGIALRKNSSYRSRLNIAILKLQEEGRLSSLKMRWWHEKRGGGSCDFSTSVDTSDFAYELGLENLLGVFVVLIIGLSVACIIAVCECAVKSRNQRNI